MRVFIMPGIFYGTEPDLNNTFGGGAAQHLQNLCDERNTRATIYEVAPEDVTAFCRSDNIMLEFAGRYNILETYRPTPILQSLEGMQVFG